MGAYIPDTTQPGVLKVTFFLIFNTDYHILEVEKDYSAALIGSSQRNHLWIMSRTPTLPPKKLKDLMQRAQRRGYDTTALIFVPHAETNSGRVDQTLSYFPYF
ncbi:MAG: lipocalin family protein [Butyricimonas faecalis]